MHPILNQEEAGKFAVRVQQLLHLVHIDMHAYLGLMRHIPEHSGHILIILVEVHPRSHKENCAGRNPQANLTCHVIVSHHTLQGGSHLAKY